MMQRGTFLYVNNRNGVPWQAVGYICQHGYDSATCGVDPICAPVGESMITWWNGLPPQWAGREVVRSRMINGEPRRDVL